MELTLEIVSFQKSLMGDGQSHTFGEAGGSIGRSRDNDWVLPDPNRYVSSRHAVVDCVDGRFRIVDVSTNGVFVNGAGTALGRDRSTPLSDGDRLVLGDYEITVRLSEAASRPVPAAPAMDPPQAVGTGAPTPPQDILDVVGRRRAEPRLGRPATPAEPPVEPQRPAVAPPTPPRASVPLPPSPPRLAPGRQPPVLDASPGLPDDFDAAFAPIAASASRRPEPSPRVMLPEDLDDLLPGAPTPARPAPPPRPAPADSPRLPDDLDDLLPAGGATRQLAPPAPSPLPPTAPPTAPPRLLPDGVPLLHPVPGTGNRQEPLSPTLAARPPVPPPAAAADDADAIVAALADGLGLDRRALEGLEPLATVAMAGRAARAAALGIADALDARAALARSAGLDPQALDRDVDNPFLVFRSGEEALRRSLGHGAGQPQSLDAATRRSVAALTVNGVAAAAALDALLDRFTAGDPPQSAAEAREIFGAAFLSAYHRELGRST